MELSTCCWARVATDSGWEWWIQKSYPNFQSLLHVFTQSIEKKYNVTFQIMKSTIKDFQSKVGLNADVWPSVVNENYITCHFIRDYWNMNSVCPTALPLGKCVKFCLFYPKCADKWTKHLHPTIILFGGCLNNIGPNHGESVDQVILSMPNYQSSLSLVKSAPWTQTCFLPFVRFNFFL